MIIVTIIQKQKQAKWIEIRQSRSRSMTCWPLWNITFVSWEVRDMIDGSLTNKGRQTTHAVIVSGVLFSRLSRPPLSRCYTFALLRKNNAWSQVRKILAFMSEKRVARRGNRSWVGKKHSEKVPASSRNAGKFSCCFGCCFPYHLESLHRSTISI